MPDETEIANGTADDCNGNGVPDECDLAPLFALGGAADVQVGLSPTGVAIADLDGDGLTDFATSNLFSGDVALVFNLGDGFFAVLNFILIDDFPVAITAADFDGDDAIDLAVAVAFGVKVMLNNGDGTFGDPVDFAAGVEPVSLAASDLDGDGVPDLAVANFGPEDGSGGSLSILINNGDGRFADAINHATGAGPASVALGDFDNDGNVDAAVANQFSDDVSVFFNEGGGVFGAAISHAAGPAFGVPASVAAGDLDDDGFVDLAVANLAVDSVSVLRNDGMGGFEAPVDHAVGLGPIGVTAADIDGDGSLDLATANNFSFDMSVLINRGDGDFRPAESFFAGIGPVSVTAGDLDADDRPELVVANLGLLEPELILDFVVSVFLNETLPPTSSDRDGNQVPDECEPGLVHVMDGLAMRFAGGTADKFISPLGEDAALSAFTFLATEPLTIDATEIAYTGPGAVPVADVVDDGGGLHTVRLDPPPAPGEWLKLTLTVTGQVSGVAATLEMWVAHHPLDVNQDGMVNIRDATAFGDVFRDDGNASLIDINGDGIVNIRDATAFGNNWLGLPPATRQWRNHALPAKP